MLQQLPQASHSLKNLLEEEWNFTKVITPYIRGGEAQSGKLFWSVSLLSLPEAIIVFLMCILQTFLLILVLKDKVALLCLVVTLLECCSSPQGTSWMLACKGVVMNSGKAQMTALPRMRLGEGDVVW